MFLIVAGLAAVAVVHAWLASDIARRITDQYLQREAQVAQEFLSSILESEGTAARLFDVPSPSPELSSFASHVRTLPGIVRANIYAPDGFIRHSSEANLVGVQFSDNMDLAESLKGRPVVALQESLTDKSDHLALSGLGARPLIEAYIPVADKDGKVVTVVEFYRKDTMIGEAVNSIKRMVWTAGVLNGAVLIVAMGLAMLVRRRRKSHT